MQLYSSHVRPHLVISLPARPPPPQHAFQREAAIVCAYSDGAARCVVVAPPYVCPRHGRCSVRCGGMMHTSCSGDCGRRRENCNATDHTQQIIIIRHAFCARPLRRRLHARRLWLAQLRGCRGATSHCRGAGVSELGARTAEKAAWSGSVRSAIALRSSPSTWTQVSRIGLEASFTLLRT